MIQTVPDGNRFVEVGGVTEQAEAEADIAKRRDDAIRRALNTPPQPRKDMPKKRAKPAAPTAAIEGDTASS